MKKYPISILIMLFLAGRIFAQQLSPFVVSSSGGFYSNTSGMLSFTTGEMTTVETYVAPSVILTQGFQQTWDFGTYTNEQPSQDFSASIYPNPSDGHFYLVTSTPENEKVEVKIMDVVGKEIFRTSYEHEGNTKIEPLDLAFAPQGVYMISVTIHESHSGQFYQVIKKINMVK